MHERVQARRAEINLGAPDPDEERRRHLASAMDELIASLDNLATLPGHRFAGVSDPATGNVLQRRRILSKTCRGLPVCPTTLRQVFGSDIAGARVVGL